MSNKIYLIPIILLFLLTSCSSSGENSDSSSSTKEVVFDDGYKTPAAGEVTFDDTDFAEGENQSADFPQSSQEITKISSDGSSINVSYDGFGNKSETRTFNNNPFLKLILLRTAVDGSKQVFVYGQNGEVKSLPENMLDKILTAPSKELANAAGIFDEVKPSPKLPPSNEQPTMTALKPLPSSQFPIQTRQMPPEAVVEEAEPTNDIAEKNSPATENTSSPEKTEKIARSKQPDEQQ